MDTKSNMSVKSVKLNALCDPCHVVPLLNQPPRREDVLRSERIAPRILNLDLR